jgi:hypothetical protein
MENFSISKTAKGFHVEGFPDAEKVIEIADDKARKIADLALHKSDLDFALECLSQINKTPDDQHITREALWRCAIVHFAKCFGFSAARAKLDSKVVYADDPGANEPFQFFKSLRDKNLVHDENPYTQCLPGAVLNKSETNPKIAKIICLTLVGHTLGQDNYSNMHLLITRAKDRVVKEFDKLCNEVTADLEAKSYEQLAAYPAVVYKKPGPDDVHKKRN